LGAASSDLQPGTCGDRDRLLRRSYPTSETVLSVDFALGVFLLAVVANIAYCAAYLADIFVQVSGFREIWQRSRWVLFVIGTLFAAIVTRFAAMGMFHPN
jgi:hypothetical protein